MSPTAAMLRLIDVAELIKARSLGDEVLRDLCEDYGLARMTLIRLKKARPKRAAEIAEYTVLIAELEEEIIRHLRGEDLSGPSQSKP